MNGVTADTLALFGGKPVRTMPFPSWPSYGAADADPLIDVVTSGRLNYWSGTCGMDLERRFVEDLGARHALATTNGTVALELALRALGVGSGDDVVVPSRSFFATCACAVAVGARPVFADIDPLTSVVTPATVEAALTAETKAIVVVHLYGYPVDMDGIIGLARDRGIAVVEDCAQALGGAYRGRVLGTIGDAGCFSFCQDKIVPVGDGGLVTFTDQGSYDRAFAYRDHGRRREDLLAANADPSPGFKWLSSSFGSNLRMPELASALALVGMDHLVEWIGARRRNAQRLAAGLSDIEGFECALSPDHGEHAYYRLGALLDTKRLADGWTRDSILEAIRAEGVPIQYGACAEMYRERAVVEAGFAPSHRLPGAVIADEGSLAFFVNPTFTDADIDDTVEAVRKVLAVALS